MSNSGNLIIITADFLYARGIMPSSDPSQSPSNGAGLPKDVAPTKKRKRGKNTSSASEDAADDEDATEDATEEDIEKFRVSAYFRCPNGGELSKFLSANFAGHASETRGNGTAPQGASSCQS